MEEFFNHFQEYLIIALVGALFFKETLVEYINTKLGLNKEEKIPKWASRLQLYFNHDTTEHHKATHQRLEKLIQMEEKEHERADEVRESLKGIDRTLAEFREYGVKIRK